MFRPTYSVPKSLVVAVTFGSFVACTETPTTPSRPIAPQSPSLAQNPDLNDGPGNGNGNAYGHVFHTKDWYNNPSNNAGFGFGNSQIRYHGGPVLLNATNVAAVYWASSPIFVNGPTPGTSGAGSADASLVGFFLSHLGGSSYFNINTTYTNGSGQHIANVVNYTQYWANNTNAPSGTQSVSDAQMVAMLQAGFNSGALTYDSSTLYAIFTAGKVNLGGGFGTQYCAYHYNGTVTIGGVSRTVLYAAMPYNYAYPSACTSGYAAANGSMDPGADYEVNTLAHETEETTTDLMGNAWYDGRGYENADKCAWTWGSLYSTTAGGVANIKVGGMDFLVQQNWLATGGCAKSH
jgi:hypothetical protein